MWVVFKLLLWLLYLLSSEHLECVCFTLSRSIEWSMGDYLFIACWFHLVDVFGVEPWKLLAIYCVEDMIFAFWPSHRSNRWGERPSISLGGGLSCPMGHRSDEDFCTIYHHSIFFGAPLSLCTLWTLCIYFLLCIYFWLFEFLGIFTCAALFIYLFTLRYFFGSYLQCWLAI